MSVTMPMSDSQAMASVSHSNGAKWPRNGIAKCGSNSWP